MNVRHLSVAAIVLVGALLSTLDASAVTRSGLCATRFSGPTWTHPTTGVSGSKYEVSTFGSAFSCKGATKLVKKFITETVKSRTSANVLTNGPKGDTCKALADKQGHAFSGSCLKMHPSPTGFGWSPIK